MLPTACKDSEKHGHSSTSKTTRTWVTSPSQIWLTLDGRTLQLGHHVVAMSTGRSARSSFVEPEAEPRRLLWADVPLVPS